jgi:hypothetical protein
MLAKCTSFPPFVSEGSDETTAINLLLAVRPGPPAIQPAGRRTCSPGRDGEEKGQDRANQPTGGRGRDPRRRSLAGRGPALEYHHSPLKPTVKRKLDRHREWSVELPAASSEHPQTAKILNRRCVPYK